MTAVTGTVALIVAASAASAQAPPLSSWVAVGFGYLGLIGIPGSISQLAARLGATHIACFVVVTATAVGAGLAMGSSEDAQAGLAALLVPSVGIPLACVVLVGESVLIRRSVVVDPEPLVMRDQRAALSERLAALLVDLVLAAAVLVVPLTMLSHRDHEVMAMMLGFVVGLTYLAGTWLTTAATVGQRLLRVRVVDRSGHPLTPIQALGRAALVMGEIIGTATVFLLPLAAVDIVLAASASGLTIVDRLTRTAVSAQH